MSAPIGNRFWEQRATHGRKQIFETPEILWAAACEYFVWCEDTPLKEHDFVGKDAEEVNRNKMMAFTIQGLCVFLGVNTRYFNDFENGLKKKKGPDAEGFSEVIARIRDTIFNQKLTGAAAGLLNANIIARDLQLVEKVQQEIVVGEKPSWLTGDLSNGEEVPNEKI